MDPYDTEVEVTSVYRDYIKKKSVVNWSRCVNRFICKHTSACMWMFNDSLNCRWIKLMENSAA